MILNIDLNPVMDRTYILEHINLGKTNHTRAFSHNPGGKGFTSLVLLKSFNEDAFLTGFLGGTNGEYYHKKLSEMRLAHEFVPIKEETRSIIHINERESNTLIVEEGPRVTREEVITFYELYSKLIERNNIICGLGSILPQGIPKDVYFDLIEMANKRKKKFILDVGVEELSYGIDATPYMVVLNQKRLEDYLRLTFDFENEIIKAGKYILDRGVEFVVIDLEDKGSLVLGKERGYRVEIPYMKWSEKSFDYSTMSSGFALGMSRNYDIEMAIRLGQAFNIISNEEKDILDIEISDIKRYMSQIEIFPINY